jgi:helix-turn-helix protein
MEPQSDNQKRKPLVSVEFQTEIDLASGRPERRMFVKMYFEARDSGLLAALPDELWKTLCCLATYIDENGNCYPSQALLAKDLGISRQHANKRIQRLLAFQFNGEPVLTVSKNRENRRGGSRWANNVYQLRPITGFAIFGEPKAPQDQKVLLATAKSSVSPQGDIQLAPVSVSPSVSPLYGDTRKGDTNQTQDLTRSFNVNDFKKSLSEKAAETADPSGGDAIRATGLMLEILDVCGDKHSRGFYRLIAQRAPEDLIFAALSETKYQARSGCIRKSRGAFFTDEIQRLARERGIDLGLNIQQRRQEKAASSR